MKKALSKKQGNNDNKRVKAIIQYYVLYVLSPMIFGLNLTQDKGKPILKQQHSSLFFQVGTMLAFI